MYGFSYNKTVKNQYETLIKPTKSLPYVVAAGTCLHRSVAAIALKGENMDYRQVGDILDKLAEELPQEFYRELSGGILLVPEAKRSPHGPDLLIMGEYIRSQMGRMIKLDGRGSPDGTAAGSPASRVHSSHRIPGRRAGT